MSKLSVYIFSCMGLCPLGLTPETGDAQTHSVALINYPHLARPSERGEVLYLLLKESRPVVLVLATMRFAAGAVIAEGSVPGPKSLVACVAWLLVIAGIYLTNASADVVADTINRKPRPLAQGMLSKRQVNRGAARSFAGAAIIGFHVGPTFLVLVTIMAVLGIFYSLGPRPGKNHFIPTGLIVGCGITLPYLSGSVAAHGEIRPAALIVGIVLGCWAALAGISKDFADIAGDLADGRRTVPVAIGCRKASLIAALGSASIAAAVPVLGMFISHPGGLWVLPVGALAFTVSCLRLSFEQSAISPAAPYRVFMMTQLATNGALLLVAAARSGPLT